LPHALLRALATSLGIAAMLACAATGVRIAEAGEYHAGATLVCSDCHVEHAGQTTAGSAPSLLKAASTTQVCLSCHDGQAGTSDVRGPDVNPAYGPRQAGALTTGGGGHEDWKGHTLDTPASPPGGTMPGGAGTLTCTSCHAAHGNANYRNLVSPTPITYAISTSPDNAADVRIDLGSVPAPADRVAAGFYSAKKIFFNLRTTSVSPYGAFCAQCHGDFHGVLKTGVLSPFRRHPTESVGLPVAYVARYNAQANKVQVMAAGNAATIAYGTGASASCMSCHKAHGNRNAFGLIFMRGSGALTEQGVEGGRYTDLCGQCHSEGA
jgi:predicted CXXCH cytochrome family protein